MKKVYLLTIILLLSLATYNAKAQRTEVTYYTSMGSFTVSLWDSLAPITVDSFIARVTEKFYDGVIFHRVIDNFMIQGGDPTGSGSGNAGYTIPDEFHSSLQNIPGALSMANAGPNTGSCQFFINLVNNAHLNNKHTVFGMVTANFSVVQAIGKTPTDAQDRPITTVKMDSIRVTKWPATVPEVPEDLAINIYPNPAVGAFNVYIPYSEATKVIVTGITGVTMYEEQTNSPMILKVDLSDQPTGMYLVRITNSKGAAYKRVIVR
ncbi:MAG: peptidylprolyl isomerase [Chitinophagales bacterium]|nr:peptidylprolyl isomerase [Chitinophagaceae bacterium]MCB9065606.1 peptidylprolyl isomerase [Chitinophagales bacterium]